MLNTYISSRLWGMLLLPFIKGRLEETVEVFILFIELIVENFYTL